MKIIMHSTIIWLNKFPKLSKLFESENETKKNKFEIKVTKTGIEYLKFKS